MSDTSLILITIVLAALGIVGGCLLASGLHHRAVHNMLPGHVHVYHFRPGFCRWREAP